MRTFFQDYVISGESELQPLMLHRHATLWQCYGFIPLMVLHPYVSLQQRIWLGTDGFSLYSAARVALIVVSDCLRQLRNSECCGKEMNGGGLSLALCVCRQKSYFCVCVGKRQAKVHIVSHIICLLWPYYIHDPSQCLKLGWILKNTCGRKFPSAALCGTPLHTPFLRKPQEWGGGRTFPCRNFLLLVLQRFRPIVHLQSCLILRTQS